MKNNVQLVGRLGAEPQIKQFESGSRVATFSLAVTESYRTRSGEKINGTQWHPVVLWGGLADVARRMLKKGAQVTVEGRLQNRTFTDRQGQKRAVTEIVANQFLLISQNKHKNNQ